MTMDRVSPSNTEYWCPSDITNHFHSCFNGGTCNNCGVSIYDARDGTGRWKRRYYIVHEEQDLWSP